MIHPSRANMQENIDAIITYTYRIVGYNSAPEARFFVDVSAVLYQEEITGAGVSKFVWLLAMGPAWIALAPVFLGTACVSLSTIRLLGIAASARHSTASSSSSAIADASSNAVNGNTKPALSSCSTPWCSLKAHCSSSVSRSR